MNIIFLDFDGVLVTLRQWKRRRPVRPGDDLYVRCADHADPDCVAALNCLCEATGAKIVVSSTWRKVGAHLNALEHVRKVLAVWGAKAEVVGVTPQLERELVVTNAAGDRVPLMLAKQRGHEIQDWLDASRGVQSFVILDDEDDMAHLLPHLVQTEFEDGLQMRHVQRAVALLKS